MRSSRWSGTSPHKGLASFSNGYAVVVCIGWTIFYISFLLISIPEGVESLWCISSGEEHFTYIYLRVLQYVIFLSSFQEKEGDRHWAASVSPPGSSASAEEHKVICYSRVLQYHLRSLIAGIIAESHRVLHREVSLQA